MSSNPIIKTYEIEIEKGIFPKVGTYAWEFYRGNEEIDINSFSNDAKNIISNLPDVGPIRMNENCWRFFEEVSTGIYSLIEFYNNEKVHVQFSPKGIPFWAVEVMNSLRDVFVIDVLTTFRCVPIYIIEKDGIKKHCSLKRNIHTIYPSL